MAIFFRPKTSRRFRFNEAYGFFLIEQNEKKWKAVEPDYMHQPVNIKQLHKYGRNMILGWTVV